jgi:hypothetical protein
MNRPLILLLLLLGSAGVASANDSARGWCEEGNRPVVTSGLNSTTRVQASHPSCTLTIYVHGGGLATIYSDNNLTPLANPFTSQTDGQWQFYAANGRYDVTMSSAGFSQTITYSDILLCDPFAVGSTCNNGGSVQAHNLLSTTHLDTIPASPPVRGDVITAQNQTSPSGVNPSWARLPLGSNNFVLTSNGVDAIWAPVASGSGCTLPGNDTGILTEHPIGTCYNSIDATWNDATPSSSVNGRILLIGDGTNSATAPSAGNAVKEVFLFGDHNASTGVGVTSENFAFGSTNAFTGCLSCTALGDNNTLGAAGGVYTQVALGYQNTIGLNTGYVFGDQNVMSGQEVFNIGESNSLNTSAASVHFANSIIAEFDATITLGGINADVLDTQMLGSFDTITVGNPSGGHVNQANCLHGVGNGNSFTITGGLASSTNIQSVSWVGKNNAFTATGNSIQSVTVAGIGNTITGPITNGAIHGDVSTLSNCSNCYIVGENVSNSTNSSLAIGMSALPGLVITTASSHDNVQRSPLPFASLPACAAGTEGSFAAITDSTTNVWGATITGSSTNHVLGYCDGTNWTVAAK